MNQFIQPEFLKHSNIYEVNIRQYSAEGNFRSFAKHLPRLYDMGVDILWLMPIHPIGVKERKGILGSYYSIRDYLDINPEFGTEEDFKNLVDEVHGYGMKIIIDWVANHAAWDNVWTETNPDFFVRDENGNFKPPYDWTDVIQIDHANPHEHTAMIAAMKYWVKDFDIDGFRADLAHLTPLLFWKNARKEIDAIKPGLVWLAETEDINYHEAFDISYAWKWMHGTEVISKKEFKVDALIQSMINTKKEFPKNALQLYFTSNHDENSWNGTEYEKYNEYAKALAVFSFTYENTLPLIYSGQELPNYKRLKFFEKDEIAWTNNIELHDFYKTLIAFRKKNKMFNAEANTNTTFIDEGSEKNILAYYRTYESESIFVLLNLGSGKINFETTITADTFYRDIFTGKKIASDSIQHIELEAGGYLVLEKIRE